MKNVRFVGFDVHAATIAVAVAEPGGEVRSLGVIPNRAESVRRLVSKLGKSEQLWQLTQLGVHCDVVAPTPVPVMAGDRVKTDRRDAEKLARCYRARNLTAVWVSDAAHEALRDLVRARLAAKRDQLRAQHRLHERYGALMGRGKAKQKVITAIGRELLGFIWAIGCEIERANSQEVRWAA